MATPTDRDIKPANINHSDCVTGSPLRRTDRELGILVQPPGGLDRRDVRSGRSLRARRAR